MRLTSLGLLLPLILTGCSLTSTAKGTPESGSTIKGKAFGGQQPINGAHVYAYAASTGASTTYIHTTFISTGLTLPTSVVPDSSGNLYLTESTSGLVYLETPGPSSYTPTSIGSGLITPTGVAVDYLGDVFIADSGSGTLYMETPNGSGGYNQSVLGTPACGATGVFVNTIGNVYTVGGSCNQVTEYSNMGPSGYSASTVLTAGSGCTSATSVAVDFGTNIYIACSGSNTVLFESNLGSDTYSESSIGTGLSSPTGVSVDPQLNVYIADTGNNRILKETALGGTSFSQSVVDNVSGPTGVTAAQDGSGLLYVAASTANSILGEIPDPTASVSLLTSASNTTADSNGNYYVTTDSGGNFSITNDYTCNSGDQVYLLATGGNSGGGPNSAISLLAILGNCPVAGTFAGVPADSFVFMNEVSTVVSAYAFAAFATDTTHVTSTGSALSITNTQNAFANAANLADLGSGTALATNPAGTATVPQAEINTLANILAACINSTGSGSAACLTLNSNIPNAPADTANAAIDLAHNPYPGATQIANLCVNQVPGALFTPDLPCNNTGGNSYPNDFTLSLTFTGNGINEPNDVAIDASGDAWITSSSSGTSDLVELSPTGVALTGASGISPTGLTAAYKVAIDEAGNIWITNNDGSAGIVELDSTGTPVGGSPFDVGTLGLTNNLAIDASNNIWLSASSSVVELDDTGTPVGTSPFTDATITDAVGIAIDASADTWLTNIDTTDVVELSSSGTTVSGSPYGNSSIVSAESDAIDNDFNVWVANYGTGVGDGSISDVSIGCCIANSGLTTGSSFGPNAIAIDSADNVWVSNFYGSIVEFNNGPALVSPSTGYTSDALSTVTPSSLAIDGSGDVWVTAYGGGTNIVSEFIGAAAPVVTPLADNLVSPYYNPASKP